MQTFSRLIAALAAILPLFCGMAHGVDGNAGCVPGSRSLVEAHNCYPYHGRWHNRLDRALSAGLPIAVEMDLLWNADAADPEKRLALAHDGPFTGNEPTLREYFFERVRPLVEQALASDDRRDWPLITLNLNDIRGGVPEMFAEVWAITGEYVSWLCTAIKGPSPDVQSPIDLKPILILAGGGALETQYFHDQIPEGGALRIFGSGSPNVQADNFRRWINYPWSAVEPGGQGRAGDWTEEDAQRLGALTANAHERGYWIRFYSLNGHGPVDVVRLGLNPGYNFGSLESVKLRWSAARQAGVDFIATDQCDAAAAWLREAVAPE